MGLENIQNIILVLSGKGGVGKSSITTQLALTLSLQGHSVGVLDIDLTGPSLPRFFGIEESKVRQAPGGWIPVPVHDAQTLPPHRSAAEKNTQGSGEIQQEKEIGPLSCMSLGFILSSRNDAVIWRGPKKTAMVRQFLTSVLWPPLNFLLIDTPPGTSDEHISLLESLHLHTTPAQLSGAIVVTTPQAISISDVKKELNFCEKVGVDVLGVIENMAGFVCPNCSECTNVFSKGGGEVMAREFGKKFLGSVPIDPAFVELVEEGRRPRYPAGTVVEGKDVSSKEERAEAEERREKDEGLLVDKYRDSAMAPIFETVVREVVRDIEAKKVRLS